MGKVFTAWRATRGYRWLRNFLDGLLMLFSSSRHLAIFMSVDQLRAFWRGVNDHARDIDFPRMAGQLPMANSMSLQVVGPRS